MNKTLENYVERLVYWAAGHGNILPLTSRCNVKCVFCSNKQNPHGIEAFNLNPLTIRQVNDIINFFDPGKPVVIGESVTRINEGEPFTHKDIDKILAIIRDNFPKTSIQITTNGSLLDRSRLEFLKAIEPVRIYLSLNSVNMRQELMADLHSKHAVSAAMLLNEYNFNWHGSIVAMPHITGWPDLLETIKYLDLNKAKTIRVFLPGYTRLASERLRYPQDMPDELRKLIKELAINTPLTIEPPQINDLTPVITGVIADSPAHAAGLKKGNIIISVNNKEPFSRADAFYMVKKAGNPVLKFNKDGKIATTIITKAPGDSSGLVMEYDLELSTILSIIEAAHKYSAQSAVLLVSELAFNIINLGLKGYAANLNITAVPVPNLFFGGNIKAAGLMVLKDIIDALNCYLQKHPRPDLVILPQISFDPFGRDLLGRHWSEVQKRFSIPVEVI